MVKDTKIVYFNKLVRVIQFVFDKKLVFFKKIVKSMKVNEIKLVKPKQFVIENQVFYKKLVFSNKVTDIQSLFMTARVIRPRLCGLLTEMIGSQFFLSTLNVLIHNGDSSKPLVSLVVFIE